MKLSFIATFVALVTLSTTRILLPPTILRDNHTRDYKGDITTAESFQNISSETEVDVENASKWDKAVEMGQTINSALKLKESLARWIFKNYPDFADTVQSPFDGGLVQELMDWGYNDGEAASQKILKDCDFDAYHKIKRAFDDLGLGTQAAVDGGPNQCMQVDHFSGPNVKRNEDGTLPVEGKQVYEHCGTEYRVTGATFEFAVNSQGMIALMNVISAAYAAEKLTWGRKPALYELPQIRSTADIAWGLWNRVAGGNLGNIKYFLVTQIMNPPTRDIIRAAYGTLTPPKSETEAWPGTEFSMDSVGGQALLGSPLGRWAGYFLLQHKRQLGNRFISKVRVFRNDGGSLPYLIFYVDPVPVPDDPGVVATPSPLPVPTLDPENEDS